MPLPTVLNCDMKQVLLILCLLPLTLVAQNKKKKDYLVKLTTDYGTMHLILYDQTPKHKENFIKLVDSSFYNGLLFSPGYSELHDPGRRPELKKRTAGAGAGQWW